ncbi:hypothetical protein IC582_026245 [Cucumis melo]
MSSSSSLIALEASSATYNGCVRPIGVHLNSRVEDDVMEIHYLLLLNIKLEDLESKEFHL